jgi:hypothetical protein
MQQPEEGALSTLAAAVTLLRESRCHRCRCYRVADGRAHACVPLTLAAAMQQPEEGGHLVVLVVVTVAPRHRLYAAVAVVADVAVSLMAARMPACH